MADGLDGYRSQAPFDRIVAPAPSAPSPADFAQARPGGQILLTVFSVGSRRRAPPARPPTGPAAGAPGGRRPAAGPYSG
ncbi:hypothetical protein ABZ858_30065 [Streptomyces sp. NPDC047017]|uniref:hypothetical protein n=1 Tax=Streptomyces sp. NPDC047017 TaxID=3155024 RepID=UPI0033E6971F